MSNKSFIVKRKNFSVKSDKNFINEINTQKTKEYINSNDGNLYYQNLDCKLFHSHHDFHWKPSLKIISKFLIFVRIASAIWNNIYDCDEVFNYWEPLHLLLFGKGFQTWEYSPIYAIRSWFYIYLHYLPASFFVFFFRLSKVTCFYLIRCTISFLCMIAEMCFFESISKILGNRIALFYIIFSIFSIGMFNVSCTFLPSTFSMIFNMFAMAAYLQKKWFYAIFCTCFSAFVGWPFAAILGIPIVLEMLFIKTKLISRFFIFSFLSASIVLPFLYFVDSYFYGKNVIAPLNIVLYNVFTSHGSNLYGEESSLFYFKNLFLHWNILLGLVIISIPLSAYIYIKKKNNLIYKQCLQINLDFFFNYWYRFIPLFFVFFTFLIWFIIFTFQKHKEERFMFPIFPLIALFAAVGLDSLLRLNKQMFYFEYLIILIFVVLSISRGYALHQNYSAVLENYNLMNNFFTINDKKLNFIHDQNIVRVCIGKEWHRFPSSFFLPETIFDNLKKQREIELQFLQSEFTGILPKHFSKEAIPNATRSIPTSMNDKNLEEFTRYVSINTCDFIIDLVTNKTSKNEPNYFKMEEFKVIIKKPFLISSESHQFFRSFYIPFQQKYLKFGDYVILQRINV